MGSGFANATLINAMAPALWHMDHRFKRIGEADGGAVAAGGFGKLFQGFDRLRQQVVFIKRQSPNTEAAAREVASYNTLQAFPHPNIVQMYGMWTSNLKEKSYLYIAMEACSTIIWHYIGVGNPDMNTKFQKSVANPIRSCSTL